MVKHETFEWQSEKSQSKKLRRMSKRRMKRVRQTTILGLLFVVLLITWWYFIVRIPNVYGQFSPPTGNPLEASTSLIFQGKKYKNISQTVIKKDTVIDLFGKSLGQMKAESGDGSIIISSVYVHPDWQVVQDKVEMGFTAVFQEEK